mmetsp:Transcript_21894/g.34002  ORF Transcript_21894/g.34002 Transcript_21894/m.34002 type:complete len:147 (-) Transcript_21894:998-1438(-)
METQTTNQVLVVETRKQRAAGLVFTFRKAKRMLRIELLQFLQLKEIVKLAATCSEMLNLIDSNRAVLAAHQPGTPLPQVDNHLSLLILIQQMSEELKTHSSGELAWVDREIENVLTKTTRVSLMRDFTNYGRGKNLLHLAWVGCGF